MRCVLRSILKTKVIHPFIHICTQVSHVYIRTCVCMCVSHVLVLLVFTLPHAIDCRHHCHDDLHSLTHSHIHTHSYTHVPGRNISAPRPIIVHPLTIPPSALRRGISIAIHNPVTIMAPPSSTRIIAIATERYGTGLCTFLLPIFQSLPIQQ